MLGEGRLVDANSGGTAWADVRCMLLQETGALALDERSPKGGVLDANTGRGGVSEGDRESVSRGGQLEADGPRAGWASSTKCRHRLEMKLVWQGSRLRRGSQSPRRWVWLEAKLWPWCLNTRVSLLGRVD